MDVNMQPIKVDLRSEEGGGRLAVIEEVVRVGLGGPPLRVHPSFDGGFYVLEGELTFQLRDKRVTARTGTLPFAARGVPHTFAYLSGHDARVLIVCTPAAFERYFDRLAAQLAALERSPETGPLPETRVVGPPIRSSSRREG